MNIKKIMLISIPAILVAFLIAVRLVFPVETKISDTKRFYDVGFVDTKLPDDTRFEDIATRYMDVEFDAVCTEGLLTQYVKGSINIGGKSYFFTTAVGSADYKNAPMIASFGEGSGTVGNCFVFISHDLSHFMLVISDKKGEETGGIWLNCTDIGDFKEATSELVFNEPQNQFYND